MKPAHVKADVKKLEIKELVAVNFLLEVPSRPEICIFHLILLVIPSSLRLTIMNRRRGVFT